MTDKFPPIPILKDYVKESKKSAKNVCKEGKNSLRSLVFTSNPTLFTTWLVGVHSALRESNCFNTLFCVNFLEQNEATAKEVGALKSVIRFIEEYKLDSDYPREHLEKRIEQLEKQKANRKRPAGASPVVAKQKHPQQPQQVKQRFKKQKLQLRKPTPQQVPINRPHMAVPVGSAANIVGVGNPPYPPYQQTHLPPAGLVADLAAPYQQSLLQSSGLLPNHPVSYAQSHLQPAGLLPDHHPAPFESSSAMAYGMAVAGSTPAIASYHGSSAEYYGLSGGPMGFPVNATTANSHIYPPEPYAPPGYGVAMPPLYHPSYYPQ